MTQVFITVEPQIPAILYLRTDVAGPKYRWYVYKREKPAPIAVSDETFCSESRARTAGRTVLERLVSHGVRALD